MTVCSLYVGTSEDLVEVTAVDGVWEARALGAPVGPGPMDWVRAILVDKDDPDRIYVGSNTQGVVRTTDGGATWSSCNEGIQYRDVWALAQHPVTGDLYAGTEPVSLFRSTDGGDTWEDLFSIRTLEGSKDWFFPLPPHVPHLRYVLLRPEDPLDLLCGIEDGWIVRSRDGGVTWTEVRDDVSVDIHQIATRPGDPSTVLVASGTGFYRSTDGGDTFVEANEGLDRHYLAGLVVHPDRPDVVLTAGAHPAPHWFHGDGGRPGMYRSEDAGQTWRKVGKGIEDDEQFGTWCMAGDPGDPDVAFVGLADGRLLVTEDGGDTCREVLELDGALFAMAAVRRG